MSEKKFYVYALLDPRKPGEYRYEGLDFTFEYEPFYVGKGVGDRWRKHYAPKGLQANPHKFNLINKLNSLKLAKTHVKLYFSDCEQDALDVEAQYIKGIGKFVESKGPLTNLADGGLATAGYKHTDAAKKKMSDAQIGRICTEEMRQRMRERQLGKKHPEDVKLRIGTSQKGKVISAEHIAAVTKNRINFKYIIETPTGSLDTVYRVTTYCDAFNLNRLALCRTWVHAKHFQPVHMGYAIREKIPLAKNWFEDTDAFEEYEQTDSKYRSTISAEEPAFYSRTKHRWTLRDTLGNETVTYNLVGTCTRLGLAHGTLCLTAPGGPKAHRWHKGYTVVDKFKLPANWITLPEFVNEFKALEVLHAAAH